MKPLVHLTIEPVSLEPGGEWVASADRERVWNFLLLVSGAAYWLGPQKARPLAEGEMLVLPAGVRGVVRASQIGPVRLKHFLFAPDLLCGFFTLAERRALEALCAGTDGAPDAQLYPSTHPATERFAALAESAFESSGLAHRMEALALVAAVLDRNVLPARAPRESGATALHRFAQLVAHMPDTEMIHHTPEQLARLCGCSPRHFNRLFRKQFGASARAHQTELRLLRARQLLSSTDARVAEVALESGYRNLSLFNSLFKKRFGETPSQWRRSARHDE